MSIRAMTRNAELSRGPDDYGKPQDVSDRHDSVVETQMGELTDAITLMREMIDELASKLSPVMRVTDGLPETGELKETKADQRSPLARQIAELAKRVRGHADRIKEICGVVEL